MNDETAWHSSACILCSINCGIKVRTDGKRHMTRIIGDRDARLSAHARELEDRVAARTEELERARHRAEGANQAKSAFLPT